MECRKSDKIGFGLKKKNRKIEKKIFFSGLARNRLKLSKSPKTRFLDQYWSIYNHFRPNFEMAKITNLHQKLPKMPTFHKSSTCRGWLGRDTNRKNPTSPKTGLTTQKLS